MIGRWVKHLLWAQGVLLAIPAGMSLYACAPWVVRPIAGNGQGLISNADVMISPAGDVAVGYARAVDAEHGGPVILARLDGRIFDYKSFDLPGVAASFAMDTFGGVYCASNPRYAASNPGATFGYDLGMWANMEDGSLSLFDSLTLPSVAVDGHGIPAVAGTRGQAMYSAKFDVRQGAWVETRVAATGMGPDNSQSLCFDSNDLGAMAFFKSSNGAYSIGLAREGAGGWCEIAVPSGFPADPDVPASVAAGREGAVGFSYLTPEGCLVWGYNDGLYTTVETVRNSCGELLAHSVAFDADGFPAVVYPEAPGVSRLHLARRTPDGEWQDEALPILGLAASLAFDDAGNPYVAAVGGDYGVTLLAPGLPTLLPGDANGDGRVTFEDFAALQNNYGESGRFWSDGDFNYDGCVSFEDFATLQNHYGLTDSVSVAAAPEPVSILLLLSGLLVILRIRGAGHTSRS